MANIGIRGVALDLFKSYLTGRSQRVKINEILSDLQFVDIGVPQGSVLGPVLFLIYTMSIFTLNLKGRITAFADDIALLYTEKTFNDLQLAMNHDLALLSCWFRNHQMVLSSKSKYTVFNIGSRENIGLNLVNHSSSCNTRNCQNTCITIDKVSSFKYLSVVLDSKLNFKEHVDNIKVKLLPALRKFYSIRQICNFSFMRCLYIIPWLIVTYNMESHVGGAFIRQRLLNS